MLKRWMFVVLSTSCAAAALACSDDQVVLAINLNVGTIPPAVTSDPEVNISGEITRFPPRQGTVRWITATGGLETAVDTANSFGLFDVTIPLKQNATNILVLQARDNTGAFSNRLEITVDHESNP